MTQYTNELNLSLNLGAPKILSHHSNKTPSVKNIGISISPLILNKSRKQNKEFDLKTNCNGLDLLSRSSGSSYQSFDNSSSPLGHNSFSSMNQFGGYPNEQMFKGYNSGFSGFGGFTGGTGTGTGTVGSYYGSENIISSPSYGISKRESELISEVAARDILAVRDPVKRRIPIQVNLNQVKKRKLNEFKVNEETGEMVNFEYVNKIGNWIDELRTVSDEPDEEMEPADELELELRDYQKQALAWMYKRETVVKNENNGNGLPEYWEECTTEEGKKYYYNKNTHFTTWKYPYMDVIQNSESKVFAKGGILADDMGMGKSIEMLSLMLTNRYDAEKVTTIPGVVNVKTTLIVCPLSMLAQWKSEILAHSKEGSISVYLFHGSNRNRDINFLGQYDVVITTYSTLSSEIPKRDSIISRLNWFRVILDEAHMIKDKKTRNAQAVCSLNAENRWAVTGTPIQNKLDDLFSLFKFLKVVPYSDEQWWKNGILKPIQGNDNTGITRLKSTLKVILLRRTKDQSVKDQPILPLPPRVSMIRKLSFAPQEQLFYDCIWNASRREFNELENVTEKQQGKMAHILELLLRLRQCCNHPRLVIDSILLKKCKLCQGDQQIKSEHCETKCVCSGLVDIAEKADRSLRQTTSTKVNGLLYELDQIQSKDRNGKSVVFSQWTSMLDIIGKTLTEAGIEWVRLDGKMSQQQRSLAISQFSTQNNIKVFLISMKAGGVGLNLTAASHVFLMDPWWNPATEEQAVDRVHRLGQTKPVSIYRFIISGSIEEKIQELQENKRHIAEKALSKGFEYSLKKQELELLFR